MYACINILYAFKEFDVGRTGSLDYQAFEKLYHSIVNVKAVSTIIQSKALCTCLSTIYRLVTAFLTTLPTNKLLILLK